MENSEIKRIQPLFPEDSTIDFKRYFSLFLSNWYWFAIVLFMTISMAYGINRYSERIYTVSSSLLIQDDQLGGGVSEYSSIFQGAQTLRSQQNLRNEIGILKSFTLNKRVIDSLPEFHIGYVRVGRRNIVERRLYKDSPFIVIPEPGKIQPGNRVNVRFTPDDKIVININGGQDIEKTISTGEKFTEGGFSFTIGSRNNEKIYKEYLSNKYFFWFDRPADVANQYRSILGINPIEENASLVTLTVSGTVPEQEADYLNKLMDLYILQGLELKNQTADSTISFISDQLDLILSKLTDAEKELQVFRSNNRLISLSTEGSFLQEQVKNLESEMAVIGLQQKYYEYLRNYIDSRNQSGDIISPTVMSVTDQILISLIQEYSQMQKQRNTLALNLDEKSSPFELIDRDLARIRNSIIENITGGEGRINTSISDLRVRMSETESDIRKLPGVEQELIRIQRKFELNNTVYTYLLEKQAETGIAKASNVSDNRIIDMASNINSILIKPRARKNYLMAILFGFLIPVLSILLIDSLNNKVIDRSDVEKRTDVPIIGYVSHNENKTEVPVFEKPGSTLSESFRSIRTNLKFFLKDNDNPVIAISSTISAEGKTFISINLATIFAMLGKRVLLMGLDLRKPRIHRVLETENGKGISTWLSGEDSFGEIIQSTSISNVFYAPSGPVPPNPAELIASEKMKEFIERAKNEFDVVIIDTPPIAIVTDALLLSPFVDIYLLVVRQRHTAKSTLEMIQDLYVNGTLKNSAIIINDISRTGYYGYGLRYGYYTGYGYTYGYSYYNAGGYGTYYYGTKDSDKDYYTE